MSDKVKLIVTLSKGQYENLKDIQCGSIGSRMIVNAVMDGTLLSEEEGEWIKIYPDYKDWNVYECSNCGEELDLTEGTPYDRGYNFCPYCGKGKRKVRE